MRYVYNIYIYIYNREETLSDFFDYIHIPYTLYIYIHTYVYILYIYIYIYIYI